MQFVNNEYSLLVNCWITGCSWTKDVDGWERWGDRAGAAFTWPPATSHQSENWEVGTNVSIVSISRNVDKRSPDTGAKNNGATAVKQFAFVRALGGWDHLGGDEKVNCLKIVWKFQPASDGLWVVRARDCWSWYNGSIQTLNRVSTIQTLTSYLATTESKYFSRYDISAGAGRCC